MNKLKTFGVSPNHQQWHTNLFIFMKGPLKTFTFQLLVGRGYPQWKPLSFCFFQKNNFSKFRPKHSCSQMFLRVVNVRLSFPQNQRLGAGVFGTATFQKKVSKMLTRATCLFGWRFAEGAKRRFGVHNTSRILFPVVLDERSCFFRYEFLAMRLSHVFCLDLWSRYWPDLKGHFTWNEVQFHSGILSRPSEFSRCDLFSLRDNVTADSWILFMVKMKGFTICCGISQFLQPILTHTRLLSKIE